MVDGKDCFNCYWYVHFGWKEVEVCCYHKIMIVADEGKNCRAWKDDNLHVDDAVERTQQKDAADLSHKE